MDDLVRSNVQAVLSARGTVGLLATITFLWSASGVFGTIILATNRAWGISQPRPFWQSRALVLSVTAVAGLLLSLSLLSPFVFGFLQALNGALPFHLPGGTRLMTTLFFLAFGTATFTIIYALAPNTRVTWRSVLPGAVLVALGWEIGKDLFAWYLKSGFARFSLVYGSLGAVITLLLWAYVSGMIVILGAELNAAIGRRHLKQVRQKELAGRLDQWADEGSHY
jgi:membrane protein